ncbi:septum formation initiator family protein [Amylibacter sp. SFDW26]|uniref:FtsB family cell division protein n=1 Tax=Amylibacter sp. SFDW26 TaxID=2652722 RepID=UPI0018698E3B
MYKQRGNSGALSTSMFLVTAVLLMAYFAFAAIQGDFGHFKRNQVNAEALELQTQLAQLTSQREYLENKTKRLSDKYLDLDLLDEQARKVLGMAREDEIIIR